LQTKAWAHTAEDQIWKKVSVPSQNISVRNSMTASSSNKFRVFPIHVSCKQYRRQYNTANNQWRCGRGGGQLLPKF